MNNKLGSSTKPTLNQHFRSQSNPRQVPTHTQGNPLKKTTMQQMMQIAGLNQTFYHRAQEQILTKKTKIIKNTQRSKPKFNPQTLQTTQNISVLKSRARNQTLNEADLIHQNWLNQTLPMFNQNNQGHIEGGSGGVIENSNHNSNNIKYSNYNTNENIMSSMKRQSSKAQQLLYQQQARAKSTLSKHENLMYNGRNNATLLGDGFMLSENNSQAQTAPFNYQTYQPQTMNQQQIAKRIKKASNHSIGMIDKQDSNTFMGNDHTIDHRNTGMVPIKANKEIRMNQTIDAYAGQRHNQTVMIEPSKKKVLITANTNMNTIVKRDSSVGKNRQQMMYTKDKRSESVNTNRPDSTYNTHTTTTQYQNQQRPPLQVNQGSSQKKKNINFTINQMKMDTKNRVASSKRPREEEHPTYNATHSNISDKSSLLGDYGGTNPVQNGSSTQTRKAAKGGTQIAPNIHFSTKTQQPLQSASQNDDSGVSSKVSQQSQPDNLDPKITRNQQRMYIMENFKPTQKQQVTQRPNKNLQNISGKVVQNNDTINIIREFDLNSDYGQETQSYKLEKTASYSGQSVPDDDDVVEEILVPNIQLSKESSSQQTIQNQNKQPLFYDYEQEQSSDAIFIQDDQEKAASKAKKDTTNDNQMLAKFEIYESSSDDELSQGAFESAAQSFQKREKGETNGSKEREQKQKDKQRRAERKKMEKRKKLKEQERQQKKDHKIAEIRKKQLVIYNDEYQDDLLNFKDSDRESLISYLEKEVQQPMVDTPTRLVNESNEFLEIQIKKPKNKLILLNKSADNSNPNSERKKEQLKKDELLKILGNQEANIKQISDNIHRLTMVDQVNISASQTIASPFYSQSLIDKLRDDTQKLKSICSTYKASDLTADQIQTEDDTVKKWLEEKKLLRIITDHVCFHYCNHYQESNDMEGLPVVIILRLFAILVYKNDERSNEIRQILMHFLAQIEQDFNKILVAVGSTATNMKEFIDQLDKGKTDSTLLFVLLSFIFKKNIRFYYVKNLNGSQESFADTGSSGSVFNEFNLVYDLSPEQVFLKFYIRCTTKTPAKQILFDLICNEFEYEILYKKTFTGVVQGLSVDENQAKHRRGISHNVTSANQMLFNASPASHLNHLGSPQQMMPDLMSQMPLANNPQALLLLQQQQEELQKLIMLKQQALLLQQQQLMMPGLGSHMLPPPGLSQLPMGVHTSHSQGMPMRAVHSYTDSFAKPFMSQQQQRVVPQNDDNEYADIVVVEESKSMNQQIEEYKKNRRQMNQSMDVSSKAFIPKNRVTPNKSLYEANTNTTSPVTPFESSTLPNAYDVFNQQATQDDASKKNIDFRVTGRLKFYSEGSSYGFIVSDIDGSDLFFHYDDMKKTNLSKQFLKDAKNKYLVRFNFKVMAYYGKYNLSKKAVDIELVKIEPLPYQPGTQQATLDHLAGRFPGNIGAGFETQFNNLNLNTGGSFVMGSNNGSFISSGGPL